MDSAIDAVLSASRLLAAVSARSLSRFEDSLALPQFRSLVVLADGPLPLTDLAEHLAVSRSTAMRMAERLQTAGMIERGPQPADVQEPILRLTESGADIVEKATAQRRAEIAEIVGRMPVGLRLDLVAALEAFDAASGVPASQFRNPTAPDSR